LPAAKRERAELDRHQKHIGAGSRLGEARGDRQARGPAGAAETEHRHARHVGSKTHPAVDARIQARRCDPGGADGDDGVDVGSVKASAGQRLAGNVDEQRFGSLEKRLGALRPASRLKIPLERFHAVTLDDAGVGENACEPLVIGKAAAEHVPCRGLNILLQKNVGRYRCREREQGSRWHCEILRAGFRHDGNIDRKSLFRRLRNSSLERVTKA
jgi:hypothetical protein